MAFDVQPDGTVRNQREFARLEGVTRSETGVTSGADGTAVDGAGRLYVSSRIGIQVFSAQGQHLGTIPVSRTIQNLAFAQERCVPAVNVAREPTDLRTRSLGSAHPSRR
jgi:gluconolactonase